MQQMKYSVKFYSKKRLRKGIDNVTSFLTMQEEK